ncbi:hypothetical protein GCM10022237_51450 [Nocardioides ginsengisoli]
MKKSNNKKLNQPHTPKKGAQRLMPQTPNSVPYTHPTHSTSKQETIDCVPLVNTPNRSPTFAGCHGVCSLERR